MKICQILLFPYCKQCTPFRSIHPMHFERLPVQVLVTTPFLLKTWCVSCIFTQMTENLNQTRHVNRLFSLIKSKRLYSRHHLQRKNNKQCSIAFQRLRIQVGAYVENTPWLAFVFYFCRFFKHSLRFEITSPVSGQQYRVLPSHCTYLKVIFPPKYKGPRLASLSRRR